MPVTQLLSMMNSVDISEQMAFDSLKDDEYRHRLESKMMTEEERNSRIKAIFGGQNGNN